MTAAPDALAGLRGWTARDEHHVIGVMTGTSAYAVDVVHARFRGGAGAAARGEGRPEVLAYRETPHEPAVRAEVLAVAAAEAVAPEWILRLDAALGELYSSSSTC